MLRKTILLLALAVTAHAKSGSTTAADTTHKGTPQTGQATMPVTTLSDTESAKILQTINEGEIAAAKAAQSRAKHAEVKQFADMMVTEHQTNMDNTKALFDKHKITPKDNEWSRQLQVETSKSTDTVTKMKGSAFDKAYIDQQVAMHEQALRTLDEKLIPSAKNAEFKTHLQTTRTHVSQHLEHARNLRKKL